MKLFQLFALVLLISLVSCQKDEEENTNDLLTNEEMVELAEDHTLAEKNGILYFVDQASDLSQQIYEKYRNLDISCGETKTRDQSFDVSNEYFTLASSADISFTLNCLLLVPESLEASFTSSGEVGTSRFASNFTAGGELIVSDIADIRLDNQFTINGSYNRESQINNLVRDFNFGLSGSVTVTDIVVNKSTSSIQGGNISLSFTADIDGREESGTADIVFHDDRTFTITAGDVVKTISY